MYYEKKLITVTSNVGSQLCESTFPASLLISPYRGCGLCFGTSLATKPNYPIGESRAEVKFSLLVGILELLPSMCTVAYFPQKNLEGIVFDPIFLMRVGGSSQRLLSPGKKKQILIKRFNRNHFRLKRLKFSNRILFQPFSVETRSPLGIVITRLPCNLPVHGSEVVNMAPADRARAVASFVLSEILEEDAVKKIESQDVLERLVALFSENERTPAVKIRGYRRRSCRSCSK